MPKFYFNLFNDVVTTDSEGVDLRDLAAAQAQARTAAAQIIAENIANGWRLNPGHRIEVEDEDHRLVFTLRFSDLVEGESRSD